jgi:serine/threonine protein kinase
MADWLVTKRGVGVPKSLEGRARWAAPEVITDDSGYGPKADIWSVGCTVIEMMTGSPPWPEFQSMWAAIYHIANSEGPPSGIPTDLTAVAQEFLDSCFERAVERRADCAQLLALDFCKVFL